MATDVQLWERRATLTLKRGEYEGNGKTRKLVSPWNAVSPLPGFNELTNLRIKFRVEKTIEPEPNRAEITVYNLKAANRNTPKGGDFLELFGGYVGHDPLGAIFRGTIANVITKRENPGWTTTFSTGDGDALKGGRLNELIPDGTSLTGLFDKLKQKVLDTGTEIMSEFNESILHWVTSQWRRSSSDPQNPGEQTAGEPVVKGAKALVGRVDDILKKQFDSSGLSFSVQNNVLIVRPKGGYDGRTAVVLSPTTGLIGTVGRTEKGIAGRCLIVPDVEPGRLIQIADMTDESLNGDYVVTRGNYSGDTRARDWYIDFEAAEPGAKIDVGGS
jgi:hypothetical protein